MSNNNNNTMLEYLELKIKWLELVSQNKHRTYSGKHFNENFNALSEQIQKYEKKLDLGYDEFVILGKIWKSIGAPSALLAGFTDPREPFYAGENLSSTVLSLYKDEVNACSELGVIQGLPTRKITIPDLRPITLGIQALSTTTLPTEKTGENGGGKIA